MSNQTSAELKNELMAYCIHNRFIEGDVLLKKLNRIERLIRKELSLDDVFGGDDEWQEDVIAQMLLPILKNFVSL